MNKPIFRTEEGATLLDDCTREIKAHAGLYLVYGDSGVGKTRLLEELAHARLDARVRWIDLAAGDSSDGALIDSSELIEKTFIQANPGDVIVADHFEMALKKSRHQLFLSWSTEGIDKQLSLVIGSNSDYLAELRQLAQHYQVRMQQFQLQPFSDENVEAFLGSYLFPDRSPGKLSIPPLLRNQLASARGNLKRIIEIAERAGDQFSNAPPPTEESIERGRSGALAAALAAVVVLLGAGWYLLGAGDRGELADAGKPATQEVATLVVEPGQTPQPPVDTATHGEAVTAADTDTAKPRQADAQTAPVGSSNEEVVDASALSADDPLAGPNPVDTDEPVGAQVATGENTGAGTLAASEDETGFDVSTGSDVVVAITYYEDSTDDLPANSTVAAESARASDVAFVSLTESSTERERLRRDLEASLAWIDTRDGNTGTLQIMLLSKARFDLEAYYEHVAELERDGVDVAQLKIVETYTGGRETYSVFYGEYPSRGAAVEARGGLVTALREMTPIVRSVAGLRAEIRRLGVQN